MNLRTTSLTTILLPCLLILSGCANKEKVATPYEVTRTFTGKVVNSTVHPRQYPYSNLTKIETTLGIFVVRNIPSFLKDSETYIVKYSDGSSYLWIEGSETMNEVFHEN